LAITDYNVIKVRGPRAQIGSLATLSGFQTEDHGQRQLDDDLWQVSGVVRNDLVPGILTQIRALGLEATATPLGSPTS
jgi:hypothetical protein